MSTLLENLLITIDFTMRVCALLRKRGVAVGTQQSIACLQAITLLGTVNKDELKEIYRATLINRKQDLWQLHLVYDLLLRDYVSPDDSDSNQGNENREPALVQRRLYSEDSSSSDAEEAGTRAEGYSTREVDHTKDFRLIPKRDVPLALAELKKIARKHASLRRRKVRRTNHAGRIDLRESVRNSVRYDGEIVALRYKRKKATHSRFVIVSDVSGSMEIYSTFLLNFLHVLNAGRRLKIENFVFSTRLERVTKQFHSRHFEEMLKEATTQFSAWSGGTKIGAAIASLNGTHGGLITPKTTIVIMSDGWDTGDVDLLDREMRSLHRRAKTIIWINPLKANPSYQPLAVGMATARPFCDKFITGHAIESFNVIASLFSA